MDNKSKKITSKVNFYFTLLDLIKNPKISSSKICKKLKISKQNLYYHRRKLQELGFLKKEKSIWIVLKSKKKDLEHTLNWREKKIRGHAFIWKVKTNRLYDWKMLLERNKIPYKLVRGYIPRIFINNKKIWLGKESITIYETKSFYGKNALESRKYAVHELQKVIESLKNTLKIDFKYFFSPVREHFGMIKNVLAQQLNKKGEKLIIRDTLDGEWFWIDDSNGMMGEMETGGKGFTKDRAKLNMEVQRWWNDMKKTDFKVTPSFLMESLNKVTQNQMVFDANMMSHLEVLENIGKAITELKDEVKKINGKRNKTSN